MKFDSNLKFSILETKWFLTLAAHVLYIIHITNLIFTNQMRNHFF